MITEMVSCLPQWFVLVPVRRISSSFSVLISVSSVPTRLFALKHGAKLVWGPEMVDKAMLNSERVVDRVSLPLLVHFI
jgi:hypothetical protein